MPEDSRWHQKMKLQMRSFAKLPSDPGPRFGLAALIVSLVIWGSLYLSRSDLREGYWGNLYVEFGGAIFDILIFGVFLSIVASWHARKQEIERQHESIEDYKRWDSEEARFRIADAIRRLNQKGIYAADFTGIQLSDFSFAKNGIRSILGSKFCDGTGGPLHDNPAKLREVGFDHLDCRYVQFCSFDEAHYLRTKSFGLATITDCRFIYADLRSAVFDRAILRWSVQPPATHWTQFDDDDAPGSCIQTSFGPFIGANLDKASSVGVVFENADFRGAKDILKADFSRATGLDTAFFDSDEIRQAILIQAKIKSES